MMTERVIDIDAPADVVWRVFSDVEKWPAMTESVTSLTALDGADLAMGRAYAIKQPKLPKATWRVTALTPAQSWEWTYAAPGNTTIGIHEVTAIGENRTRVRQAIVQKGIVGALIGKAMRSLTERYLDMEGAGLKKLAERAAHA
jgi:uncharacterized membrane protein